MAYNKQYDYSAAIKKEKNPQVIAQLEAERAAKVADAASQGFDLTKASDLQKFYAQPTQTANSDVLDGSQPVRTPQPAVTQPGATTPPAAQGVATPPTVQAGYQPTDYTAQIKAIYDQQMAAQNAQLNASRDQANSDYQAQIDATPDTFRPKRDAVDVATLRNQQNANEVAAAKGIAFSGGVQSDMMANQAAGEGQKTALTQQEIQLVQGLKKAISDNNRATSMKQLELSAQTQAQQNQALLAEQQRQEQMKYQVGRDQSADALNLAGLTGYYGGNRTLAGQQMDTAKDQYNQQMQYQVGRDQVADKQWQQQQAQQTAQQKAQQEQWNKTFDYQKNRDKVADGQWLKQFTSSEKDAAASRAIAWGNQKLNREQFEWSKSPDNPNNVLKAAKNESKAYQDAFSRALDMIGKTKKGTDEIGQITDVAAFNEGDIYRMLRNDPNLTPDEVAALVSALGIK